VKTVAGFMNSESGGSLIIGVDDSGTALGLDRDLATFGKKHNPKDEFEQYLQNIIRSGCGKESLAALVKISFHPVDKKEICKIEVKPSHKPVYVTEEKDEKFFVRSGNTTQSLSMREAHEYIRSRFG
jgi:predicted HTH transcriptional regulator